MQLSLFEEPDYSPKSDIIFTVPGVKAPKGNKEKLKQFIAYLGFDISVIDKFILHGDDTTKYLDGGSALHLNLEDYPTKETCKKLLDIAVKTGCPYFCTNVKVTICNKCGYINKKTENHCIKCGSTDIDYATRVIGYLRRVTNFSKERQEEESRRHYHRE